MEKILVEVYVPVIHKCYDVYLPLTSKLYEIEGLLANAVKEISGGYFAASEDTVICDRETGKLFDVNKSAFELELQNGSRLMLI